MTKMMTKSPQNDSKIESTSSRSSLISKFHEEKMNSSFKRRNQEDFTREVLKRFFKNKHSTILFSKEFFSKFSKLPEFLLSGNRLPISCNPLPVAKFDFKSFQLNLQHSN